MSFAVVVTFTVRESEWEPFLTLMQANARTSRAVEPGCQQFDVCTDPDRPQEVFLYEIYDDAAAFEAHLASDHFATFDKATAKMILTKDVRTYQQVTT